MMEDKRFILGFILSLALVFFSWPGAQTAQASCGAVSCFVVIGSQQQVPQAGLLTVNAIYNYTPMRLLNGTNGIIPGLDQSTREMILDHHQEIRTITQQATLDLNYGLTERFGLEVTLPYMWRTHHHIDGLGEDGANGEGEPTNFSANGIGDIRVGLKYNMLPTLRSMVVLGFGVYLPTGSTDDIDSAGNLMESTTQLGRGQVGLNPTIYQTYELMPHRLNQFASASYRHTFRNNDGYQFGDQWDLNGGFNLVTVPWLVLAAQLNYRYMVHDNFNSSLLRSATPADGPAAFPGEPIVIDPTIQNRDVPTTGSTFLAFTPGFQLSLDGMIDSDWTRMTSVYFYSSIPVVRDSNNSLAQGTSYIFGLTRSFQMMNPS
jgi:Putative MetA-pathway of phenol degradation